MASRQRAKVTKKQHKPNQLIDLGLFEIPDLDAMSNDIDDDVDNESDLESELHDLLSGKMKPKAPRPKRINANPLDLDKMVAESLKDISDEDDSEDLDDPDLLNELKKLSCESPEENVYEEDNRKQNIKKDFLTREIEKSPSVLSLLEERLQLYDKALSVAKAAGENSKVRRYLRAKKNLEDLLKRAHSGQEVNVDDIPPPVSISKPPNSTTLPESHQDGNNEIPKMVPKASVKNPTENSENKGNKYLETLNSRIKLYKAAALQSKKSGDKATALEYMKNIKILNSAIEKAGNSEIIDLAELPPTPPSSPSQEKVLPPKSSKKEYEETQTSHASMEAAALSAASEPEDPALFAAPPAPNTVLEALEQRLQKYKATHSAAEAEGNSSKKRRLERIVKLYEKTLKDYTAGKEIDWEELPIPPGFAPIPIPTQSNVSAPPLSNLNSQAEKGEHGKSSEGSIAPALPVKKNAAPVAPPSKNVQPQKHKVRTNSSLVDKKLQFLLERQRLFREAALASKKAGNMDEAKEYLRMSKGFDSMIEAARGGLPVDCSSAPTPPQLVLDTEFVIVDVSECVEGPDEELFEILLKDLSKQIEICRTNKEHFLKLADVLTASKFEKLGLESSKDLAIISHLKKANKSPPKFHYETRMFSVVQCNNDLSDNDLEVTIERGINLPGKPDDLDSFIKIEFPFGNDGQQKARTNTLKDTNNPIFQETFTFTFNRKSRSELRKFKRHVLKLEVMSKGGFFKSDSILGTVHIKLNELESSCNIHNCFEIMDGRKSTGGKIECKIRIREPLLTKQVEQVQEKWLVIGS